MIMQLIKLILIYGICSTLAHDSEARFIKTLNDILLIHHQHYKYPPIKQQQQYSINDSKNTVLKQSHRHDEEDQVDEEMDGIYAFLESDQCSNFMERVKDAVHTIWNFTDDAIIEYVCNDIQRDDILTMLQDEEELFIELGADEYYEVYYDNNSTYYDTNETVYGYYDKNDTFHAYYDYSGNETYYGNKTYFANETELTNITCVDAYELQFSGYYPDLIEIMKSGLDSCKVEMRKELNVSRVVIASDNEEDIEYMDDEEEDSQPLLLIIVEMIAMMRLG